MKKLIKIVVIISFLFPFYKLSAQETFNLKYKFEKGKTYLYRTISISEMSMDINGQEMSSKGESRTKTRMEIADISNEKIEIITSLDSMYSKYSNSMGGEDNIRNGEEYVGKKSKLIYSTLGKKLGIIEIDKSTNEMGMPVAPRGALFIQLSEKPVKIGDEWNVANTDTNKFGEAGMSINKNEIIYKVEGKETKNGIEYLRISMKSNSKSEGSMSQGGMNAVSEGKAKTTGTILFDLSKGVIYSFDTESEGSNSTTYVEQNRTMPMTSKSKSTTILIEK